MWRKTPLKIWLTTKSTGWTLRNETGSKLLCKPSSSSQWQTTEDTMMACKDWSEELQIQSRYLQIIGWNSNIICYRDVSLGFRVAPWSSLYKPLLIARKCSLEGRNRDTVMQTMGDCVIGLDVNYGHLMIDDRPITALQRIYRKSLCCTCEKIPKLEELDRKSQIADLKKMWTGLPTGEVFTMSKNVMRQCIFPSPRLNKRTLQKRPQDNKAEWDNSNLPVKTDHEISNHQHSSSLWSLPFQKTNSFYLDLEYVDKV